ncbi:MAG: hypothetical protein P8Y66_12200 [Nitrospirota bacterium]|jgi:hypothetical protein
MKCPLLEGNYISCCHASRDIYVPSGFELKEYCTTSTYRACPLYLRARSGSEERFAWDGRDARSARVRSM